MAATKQMLKGLRTATIAAALLAAAGSFGLVGHASADGGTSITFTSPTARANQITFNAPAATPAGTMTLLAPEPSQSTGTITLLAPEPNTGSGTLVLTATPASADTGSHAGN